MSEPEGRLRLFRAPTLDPRLAGRMRRRIGANDWIVLALDSLDPPAPGSGADELREEPDEASLLERDFELALVAGPKDRAPALRHLPSLVPELRRLRPELLMLVGRRTAPDTGQRSQRKLRAFVCTPAWLARVLPLRSPENLGSIVYDVCRVAWSDHGLRPRLLVREYSRSRGLGRLWATRFGLRPDAGVPQPPAEPAPGEALPTARVVIPHRGDLSTVERLLAALAECPSEGLRVSLGFDEAILESHLRLVKEYPDVDFFGVEPEGGGPYVLRHFLGTGATEDLVIFQDSDDLPTVERFDVLRRAMLRSDADVLGAQELRVEEYRERVRAVRYALDVNRALSISLGNPQLHPGTAVRTESLRKAGGFSTVRRFASDREFLMRYVHAMRGRNLPQILYVRLRTETTLTRSADTGMQSRERLDLREAWARDFDLVRSGRKRLEDTSLAVEHADTTFGFTELRTGRRTEIRF